MTAMNNDDYAKHQSGKITRRKLFYGITVRDMITVSRKDS